MHLKKLSTKFMLLYLLFLVVFLVGCTSPTTTEPKAPDELPKMEPTVETAFLMGTVAKITVYDDEKELEPIFKKAFDRVIEIEERMTINKEDVESEILKLNNNSGLDYVNVSPDTFFVLERGKYYSEMSAGIYDITVGPIVKLWNIGMEEAKLPKESEIQAAIPLVEHENLILDKENQRAKLTEQGMIVDLGSIAKGYAADEVARILEESGIKHGIVNLGGNISVINKKPDGSHWRLGLQDPLKPRGDHMGVVLLDNESLVTSGTYERYLEKDGKKHHHILNPDTGYPEENSILSTSIVTKESIDADALSTVIFLLGLEEGLKKIEELAGTEAIFITADKKVYYSSGINEENFEITKEEYQLQN